MFLRCSIFILFCLFSISVFSQGIALRATNSTAYGLTVNVLTNAGSFYSSLGALVISAQGQLYIDQGLHIGALWHSGAGTLFWPDGPSDGTPPDRVCIGSTGNMYWMNGGQWAETNGVVTITNTASTFAGTFTGALVGNGASITNINTIGNSSGVVTNNGVVWFVTNNTPAAVLPNGSIASVTDGRFYVRSNAAWVLH